MPAMCASRHMRQIPRGRSLSAHYIINQGRRLELIKGGPRGQEGGIKKKNIYEVLSIKSTINGNECRGQFFNRVFRLLKQQFNVHMYM